MQKEKKLKKKTKESLKYWNLKKAPKKILCYIFFRNNLQKAFYKIWVVIIFLKKYKFLKKVLKNLMILIKNLIKC